MEDTHQRQPLSFGPDVFENIPLKNQEWNAIALKIKTRGTAALPKRQSKSSSLRHVNAVLLCGVCTMALCVSAIYTQAQTTLGGDHIVEGDLTIGTSAASGDLNVPYGNVAIGGSTVSGNARLILRGRGTSSLANLDMYNSQGTQTFLFTDGGSLYQRRGIFVQSNQYNSRTFTLDSGQGYLDANEVFFLNRWTSANIYFAYGGGRVGLGTNNVSSARMEIVNNASSGVTSDAVLRLVAAPSQAGNIFEALDSDSEDLFILKSSGDVEMRGKVTMPRQGDILMGEFGNLGD